MRPMEPNAARQNLADSRPASTPDVIRSATDGLVEGLDSQSLRELAGTPIATSQFMLSDLIEGVTRELGIPEPQDDAHASAVKAMARRTISGEVAPRDLAHWAHAKIGHEGDPTAQPFVDLDDIYDTSEYLGYAPHEIDDMTLREAQAIVDGVPSPRLAQPWPPAKPGPGPHGSAG